MKAHKRKRNDEAKEKPPSVKQKKLTDATRYSIIPYLTCCERHCVKQFCNPDDLQYLREKIANMNEHQRSNYIADKIKKANPVLQLSDNDISKDSHEHLKYELLGKACCRTAFQWLLGISKDKLDHVRHQAMGIEENIPSNRPQRVGPRQEILMAWWHSFLKEQGQYQTDGQIHLHYYHVWRSVYKIYLDDLKAQHLLHLQTTFKYFTKIRRKHFKHVHMPRVIRMSKCTKCVYFSDQRTKRLTPAKRKTLNAEIEEHNAQHRAERIAYLVRCRKAALYPKFYMSIIVDGASHKPFPFRADLPKAMDNIERLKVGVTAVIDHYEKATELHIRLPVWPNDTNLVISIIWQHICNESKKNPLPKTLYLQLDNCYRENKNIYMLSFLEWLVERQIFTKVKLSFMLVGHTHCDVDQLHSVWVRWLDAHNCDTPVEFLQQVPQIFAKHKLPAAQITTLVYDWKAWMVNHINNTAGHAKPHCFKIQRNQHGVPVMYYKYISTDVGWKGGNSVLNDPLKSIPKPLAPVKIDTEVLTSLSKILYLLQTDEAKQWFQDLIQTSGLNIQEPAVWYWPPPQLQETKILEFDKPTKEFNVRISEKAFQLVTESTRIHEQDCVIVNQQEPNHNADFRLAKVERTIGGSSTVFVRYYTLVESNEGKNHYAYGKLDSKAKYVPVQRTDLLMRGALLTANDTLLKAAAKALEPLLSSVREEQQGVGGMEEEEEL